MLSRDRAPVVRDPAIPQVNLKPTDRLEHCLRAVRPPLHHNLVAVLLRPLADRRFPPERVAIPALNLVPVEHFIDSSVDLGAVILAAPLRRNPNRGPRVRAITRRELVAVQRLRTERRAVRRTRQRAIETENNLGAIRRIRKPLHQPTHLPTGHAASTRRHQPRSGYRRTVQPPQGHSPTARPPQPRCRPDSPATTARPHS